jgi:hypothetical protein
MYNKFFGSKLNTVLLLILIVLMIIAIKIMWLNKEVYLHPLSQKEQQVKINTDTPQISGNEGNLVSFSIAPGQKVSGVTKFTGSIDGGYFFEANILINVLDNNKKILKNGHATATTEWTKAGPVGFAGSMDFTSLPKGPAFIQIHNDNPSGLAEYDYFILVPIIIE